ncbi:MAG: MBL fold metallo-hydrolase [Fimbriimonadaceae bacterium]|nr:MBL fold metallo-hydrolase [Alphaproteobacteria bacterium]
MQTQFDILVTGASVGLTNGFIGWSSIVLIKSGSTRILFDCGHHVTRPALLEALGERGLTPDDIDILFISHLHFDHVLNFDLFPHARILVSETEWAYAETPHEKDIFVPGFIRSALESTDLMIFSGTPEIARGVQTLHTPGHTPGHHSLVITTAEQETVVIAGDAIKTAQEALLERSALEVMQFDPEERSQESIQHIKEIADRIIPGHYPPLRKHNDTWVWDEVQPLSLVFR